MPSIPEPLTRVATRVRAWTLAFQLVCSTVAALALAHPDALTGAAQVFGLVTYVLVCLGTAVATWARVQDSYGCGSRRIDLDHLARSPQAHFHACVVVNAALLTAMLLLVGNTEDARSTSGSETLPTKESLAFHRIEVAAFFAAVGWGTHLAHCAVAYVIHKTTEEGTVRVDVGGLYQPLLEREDWHLPNRKPSFPPPPAAAA
jgi:hypothetical protein